MNTEVSPSTAPSIRLAWTDHVLLLVDGSGSMDAIRQPTLQSLNAFIRDQAAQPHLKLRVVQFRSDEFGEMQLDVLFDPALHRPSEADGGVRAVAIQRSAYEPNGGTPLYAAVIGAITRLEARVKPQDHVLVVIQTDGFENASGPDFTLDQVRARIAEKTAEGWVFAYLGAELESWRTGDTLGVAMLNTFSYSPTALGVRTAFQRTSEAVDRWRNNRDKGSRQFYQLQLPPGGAAQRD